ncbi:MAG: DsbC family protein [Betaproteobacteria bacterium]|nr:MAG: DsbC family protein [Betaproteobacteria bacterium]
MTRGLLLLAAFAVLSAHADEAAIRQVIEAKLGGAKVEGVQATPVPGIFEVRYRGADGPRIVYTDAQAQHIFVGEIIDARTERNLTEERLRKASAINMESLPYDLAVKVQRGNGKRTLVVFSDPYCPACFEFEKTLARVDDITIHYFMYPVIRPELADHSRAVWCAADRAKAWLDLAQRRKPPAAGPGCETPIDKILAFGGKLGIRSTPTIFFANGERVRGGVNAVQLRSLLDEATAQKSKK